MEFLALERRMLEEHLPGFDHVLTAMPLMERERSGTEVIRLFRESSGPGLLIPRAYAGLGADPLTAIRIQRALASRSPSLAIATTMHHFSLATLIEVCSAGSGLEWMLLQAIAQQRLLVASGFAEGQAGRGILEPRMQATQTADGFVVNGSKKPCSLTWSADLLTISVALPCVSENRPGLAVMLVPSNSAGIERRKFWGSWVLAGAESDEIILRDVLVPDRLVFKVSDTDRLDPIQVRGFLWFELLISASYLGVASALVERVICAKRGECVDRAMLGVEVEGAMAALEGVARAMIAGQCDADELARVLFVRFAVERAVERVSARAVELLGGMAFVGSSEISYLYAAARALAFHPPSRTSISQALTNYLMGEPLGIQ